MVILTFHGVGPVLRDLDEGERDCWLDEETFHAVLDLACSHSYVRLTFDDGNASDATFALPALAQRGLSATFFVCSGRLDRPTFLSRHQLQILHRAGMTIGSHGVGHRPWRGLPAPELDQELRTSRSVLANASGSLVTTAACPFGSYDRRVLRALRTAGYETVFTSDQGWTEEHHWIRARNTIRRSTPISAVEALIQFPPRWYERAIKAARSVAKRCR